MSSNWAFVAVAKPVSVSVPARLLRCSLLLQQQQPIIRDSKGFCLLIEFRDTSWSWPTPPAPNWRVSDESVPRVDLVGVASLS